MKTVIISVDDRNLPKLIEAIEQLGRIQSVKEKPLNEIDIITLASQESLAEDWDSIEDSRYENILNNEI